MLKKYSIEEIQNMSEDEFNDIIDNISVIFFRNKEINLDETCINCPFNDVCGKIKLFYQCGIWEDSLGENL